MLMDPADKLLDKLLGSVCRHAGLPAIPHVVCFGILGGRGCRDFFNVP